MNEDQKWITVQVATLARSDRGRGVLSGLLPVLRDHMLGLDERGKWALIELFHAAFFQGMPGSVIDAMSFAIENPDKILDVVKPEQRDMFSKP